MAEPTPPAGATARPRGRGLGAPDSPRRLVLAQALAFVGLVAALVGALGPAEHVRTTYSWPPPDLPETTPSHLWYTPLLLIRHRPESISAAIPCSPAPALRGSARPTTLLATARSPETAGGLAVVREGTEAVVSVGAEVLGRIPLRSAAATPCSYELRLGGGRWSLEERGGERAVGGALAGSEMPVVNGLFSSVDLRAGPAPEIDVTTAVHATRSTLRQTLARVLAVLCIAAALLLVGLDRRPRPSRALVRGVRGAAARAHPVDAVVAAVLLGWWVISPGFVDDGWIYVRELMFSVSGGFSAYYNAFGTNLPNDYWLEWAQHWVSASTSALVFQRLPALGCLVATWVLCRWILSRILSSSGGGENVVLWALAASFLVGALAWGMTLRPEPVTALLITASLACVVLFLERGSAAALVALAVLVPLAVTAHHAGVAALAPVLAAAPSVFRWARARLAVASTIVASSIALLVTLLFVGSDLEQRRSDAQLTSAYGSFQFGWRDEVERYARLATYPSATPLRRASVALIALALLAFLLRRRREGHQPIDLPAVGLGVSLVLFIVTPTKLTWHFGALLGVVAVAVAAETARICTDSRERPARGAWPFAAIGVAVIAIAWSWSPRLPWSTLDLRTLRWTLGFEEAVSVTLLAALLPVAALGGAALIALATGRRHRLAKIPWLTVSWIPPLFALPLIAFTAGVLVADTAKSESWTLLRQNIADLRGDSGCALADDLVVARKASMKPLGFVAAPETPDVPIWVPPAPVPNVQRFVLGPQGDSVRQSPWFELPGAALVGLFVAGTTLPFEALELEWGRRQSSRVVSLEASALTPPLTAGAESDLTWRFVAAGALPARRPGADVVRVVVRGEGAIRSAVAVTAPVTYTNEPLVGRVMHSPTLVHHYLVSYFPCLTPSRLSAGTVETPQFIVVAPNSPSPIGSRSTSPFAGLLDVYRLELLSLADSADPPIDVVVFEVDRRIPGATLLPAVHSARTS